MLAGEAYLARLRKLRRQLLPIYSLIVLTEPLSEERWDGIGWEGASVWRPTAIRSTTSRVPKTGAYCSGAGARPTTTARAYATSTTSTSQRTRCCAARREIGSRPRRRAVHPRGGPLAVPRDWMPTMSWPIKGRGHCAYTGQGVATANLSGRTLADLILGRDTGITRLPTVDHEQRPWEPEPLRWLGARYVQRPDESGRPRRADREPPTGKTLAERLGRH